MPDQPFDWSHLPPQAQATYRAGILMQQMVRDPEAAKAIQPIADAAAKRVNPAHQTAAEIAAPFVAQVLQAVDQKFAEREAKSAEATAIATMQQQIQSAMANEGFTDEGIKNILQTMKDKNIGDFETAKKAYRFDNPARAEAPRSASDSMYWNVDKNMQVGDAKSFFFPGDVPSIAENAEMWEKETALKYLNGELPLPAA